MAIRTGSWDRFAEYIRWSRPPSSPPQQASPYAQQAIQLVVEAPSASPPAPASAGSRQPVTPAGPAVGSGAAKTFKPPAQRGWLGRLLQRVGF